MSLRKIMVICMLFLSAVYAETTELVFNVSEYGAVDKDQLKHYKIHANAGDKIKVRLYDMDADGDLYVKVGSPAADSTTKSDCHSWNSNTEEDSCELTIENDTDVYIAVHAAKCIYNVEHRIVVTKENMVNTTTLTYNEPTFGIVDKDQLKHYKIHANAGDKIKVKLYDMDADGDLYVKVGSPAADSTTKSDCHSWNSNTEEDSCELTIENDTDVYIAVHAAKCINNVEHKLLVTKTLIPNNSTLYSNYGPYETDSYNPASYLAYYPKNDSDIKVDTPVVFFLPGMSESIDKYSGIMEFIASKGYMVIGAKNPDTDFGRSIQNLEAGLNDARRYHDLTANNFIVMGHSVGGGNSFVVMKHFQNIAEPCGSSSSLVLSIDGYFPYGMSSDSFSEIQGSSAFLQMDNGLNADGEDPLITLTTWKLSGADSSGLLTLHNREHKYVIGDKESIANKEDLRLMIGSLIHDSVKGGSDGFAAIPANNKKTFDEILQQRESYGGVGACEYGATIGSIDNIDFCSPDNY